MTTLRVRVPSGPMGLALALQAACKAASLPRGSRGEPREAPCSRRLDAYIWVDAWSDRHDALAQKRGLAFVIAPAQRAV